MTFDIEELELAKNPLPLKQFDQIIDLFSTNINAHSSHEKPLVNYGKQSFIRGMHQAYADHRPFTLTPDIIWLLICQGFSRHVNFNSDELRHLFVQHTGKKELIVRNDSLIVDPQEWENAISALTKEVAENVGKGLINTLSANFSTTTTISKIACEVTILDTFKSFFEYSVISCVCGIPTITIEGTIEDWEKISHKAQQLKHYQLDYWIDEIVPIIEQIIETLKGNIDKVFWRNMYKIHTPEEYAATDKITGWITKFFPYDKLGKKTSLEQLDMDYLPDEICFVDFKWKIIDGLRSQSYSMQFASGFIGLSQNPNSLALKPEIGWWVCEKSPIKDQLPKMHGDSILNYYQIDAFPKEVLRHKDIYSLGLSFKKKIKIPFSIGKMQLGVLSLNGEITPKEIKRIQRLLPFTLIYVNATEVSDGDGDFDYLSRANYFYKTITIIRRFIRL